MWLDISESASSWSNALIVNTSQEFFHSTIKNRQLYKSEFILKNDNISMILLQRVIVSVTILVLCRPVETSATLMNKFKSNDDEDLQVEKILEKFMVDLKKITVDKCSYKDVIILAKESKHFQAAMRLTEGSPCVITTPAAFTKSKSFCVAAFFIDGVNESELNSTFMKIPKAYSSNVWLISTSQNTNCEMIATQLQFAQDMKLWNVQFAHLDPAGVMKIYRIDLFPDCSYKLKLVISWTSENGFTTNPNIFDLYRLSPDMLGCRRRISSLFEQESMTEPEKSLIKAIADDLHFIPVIKKSSVQEEFWILEEVSTGEAEFGIGNLRPTLQKAEYVEFTRAYAFEYLVWTVPAMKANGSDMIFSEFSSFVWVMISLLLLYYSLLACLISKFETGKYHLLRSTCDVISITLNYAIRHHPAGITKTSLFILYSMYARILMTAYSTSLASILTLAPPITSGIQDEIGIVASDFRIGGSAANRIALIDQINLTGTSCELINRYEIITSTDEALRRIYSGEKLAFLQKLSEIDRATDKILMKNEPIIFYPIMSDRVRLYGSSISVGKGSAMTERIDNLVLRFSESGIAQFWEKKDPTIASVNVSNILEWTHYTLDLIESMFTRYLSCLALACLVFIGELIFFRLRIGHPPLRFRMT